MNQQNKHLAPAGTWELPMFPHIPPGTIIRIPSGTTPVWSWDVTQWEYATVTHRWPNPVLLLQTPGAHSNWDATLRAVDILLPDGQGARLYWVPWEQLEVSGDTAGTKEYEPPQR